MTVALLLTFLAVQDTADSRTADRAVVTRPAGGSGLEIRDPAVVRMISTLLKDEKALQRGETAWTVTFYSGPISIRAAAVSAAAGKLMTLLRNLERIEPLSRELGHDDEAVRVRATRELTAMGRPALEPLTRVAESAEEAEVKFRATQIVRDIREALRPKVQALFFHGRREAKTVAPFSIDEWVRRAAADQGFATLSGFGYEWTEISLEKGTLFPAAPSAKPGGIYVSGKTVEWSVDGSAVVELTCSVKSWTQGKFSLDAREPGKVIRLSDQKPLEDLFVAIRIAE